MSWRIGVRDGNVGKTERLLVAPNAPRVDVGVSEVGCSEARSKVKIPRHVGGFFSADGRHDHDTRFRVSKARCMVGMIVRLGPWVTCNGYGGPLAPSFSCVSCLVGRCLVPCFRPGVLEWNPLAHPPRRPWWLGGMAVAKEGGGGDLFPALWVVGIQPFLPQGSPCFFLLVSLCGFLTPSVALVVSCSRTWYHCCFCFLFFSFFWPSTTSGLPQGFPCPSLASAGALLSHVALVGRRFCCGVRSLFFVAWSCSRYLVVFCCLMGVRVFFFCQRPYNVCVCVCSRGKPHSSIT